MTDQSDSTTSTPTKHDAHSGRILLRNPRTNKGTAFSREERERYGLRGLLPHMTSDQRMQVRRILGHLRRKEADIERYIALNALQDRNERLFYRTLIEHIDELMPIVYTPTVGQACREFAQIYRQAKGLYITPDDRGRVRSILDNWPEEEVRVVVVTDGERILGLGDLGANGMGIPIGKLALYVACAGVPPEWCMPVMLDVGTENRELLEDPLYMGYPHERVRGDDYYELVDEFITAVTDCFPGVLIQFEDFLTPRAYALLDAYRDRVLCFNDDIQGTAAVTLAGVMASTRLSGVPFENLRIMFVGAGSASTGIGRLIASALEESGLSREDALGRLWFIDSKGLVVSGRDEIAEHKREFAHDHPPADLQSAVEEIRPHILIGATGVPGTFPEQTVRTMADINERPGIFALSNPTSQAECTAEQAYEWTDGRALFASGSPFDAVERDGRWLEPAQGNNAYVFPGIGLGAIAARAHRVPDSMFMAAARALADTVSDEDLSRGALYPGLSDIRLVSLNVADAVAGTAYRDGVTDMDRPDDVRGMIADMMYDPSY